MSGPLIQLIPTQAAPSSSNFLQTSGIGIPSFDDPDFVGAIVITAGRPLYESIVIIISNNQLFLRKIFNAAAHHVMIYFHNVCIIHVPFPCSWIHSTASFASP